MCRIIGFLSGFNNIENGEMVYRICENISCKNLRVCLVDLHFGMNISSTMFKVNKSVDLKEYLIGKLDSNSILNKVSENLFYVKSNCFSFNYEASMDLINYFIQEISEKFDFIILDFTFNNLKYNIIFQIPHEIFIFCSDREIEIRNTSKIISYLRLYSNILSIKLIIYNARVFLSQKKRCLNAFEIGSVLKVDIILVIPKFLNIKSKINLVKMKKLLNDLTDNILLSKSILNNYSKKYCNLIDKLRFFKYE